MGLMDLDDVLRRIMWLIKNRRELQILRFWLLATNCISGHYMIELDGKNHTTGKVNGTNSSYEILQQVIQGIREKMRRP